MELEQIIEKIKIKYEGHNDLEEIVNDLSDKSCIDHWAQKFCEEEFGHNKELARELFNKAIELAKDDMSDLRSIADSIADSDCLGDKTLAKSLYEKVASNLNELSDYTNLISSLSGYLEDNEWSKSLINEAKQELLNAEDKSKFAGFSREIFDLAEYIIDSEFLNDKDSAKEVFEILKTSDGVTDLLDAARKVQECYEDDPEYVESFMNECLNRAIEYVDYGYYCDIYSFIKDELEDEDRADEFKDEYIDEMQSDFEEYGSCEELFEDSEDDIDLDDIDFDDFEDKRNIIAFSTYNLTFMKVEEMFDEDDNLPEEAYELMNESVDEFIDEIRNKIEDNVEDKVYIQIDGKLKEYNSNINAAVEDIENMYLYMICTKEIPADILNALFLDMDEYGFYGCFENNSEVITQGYDYGEYDTGYFSNAQDEAYINNFNYQFTLYPEAKKLLEN